MKVVDIVREYLKDHNMEGLCEDESQDYDPECSCTCRIDDLMSYCCDSCAGCVPMRMVGDDDIITGHGSMNIRYIVERYMIQNETYRMINFDGECRCGWSRDGLFLCGGVWGDCSVIEKRKDIKPCPMCGDRRIETMLATAYSYTMCYICGTSGPRATSVSNAENAWNARISDVCLSDKCLWCGGAVAEKYYDETYETYKYCRICQATWDWQKV